MQSDSVPLEAKARRQALGEKCAAFRVEILWVFGSRASEIRDWLTDCQALLDGRTSDVDVGVLTAHQNIMRARQKVRLAQALEELLQVDRVDLTCLNDADPFLAANIIRGEMLYAADSYQAAEYELYVLRRAGDLAHLERERLDLILGRSE